jgi:uncharacterized membrane protein
MRNQKYLFWAASFVPTLALAGAVGSYLPSHSGRNGIFKWFNVDGAEHTIAYGAGEEAIVGVYETEASSGVCNQQVEHGFITLDAGKHIRALDFPGATSTEATAINEDGIIAGIYSSDCDTTDQGFLYRKGKFSTLALPATAPFHAMTLTVTYPDIRAISEEKDIAGGFTAAAGGDYGFLLTEEKKFVVLEVCDEASIASSAEGCLPASTDGWGLNSARTVVGHYEDNVFNVCVIDDGVLECSNHHHGFIWKKSSGFTSLSCDGDTTSDTDANAISDKGVIVGRCDSKAFVLVPPYRNSDWTTFSISDPAMNEFRCPEGLELNKTIAYGISDEGKIVGNYTCENPNPTITSLTHPDQSFAFAVNLGNLIHREHD